MTVTRDQVLLSRRAARVRGLLNPQRQQEFVNAVRQAVSISTVVEPYRSWLIDPRVIPEDDRSKIIDPKTQMLVPRPTSMMRID